jgi:predicted MFS family arabinose efflux permease
MNPTHTSPRLFNKNLVLLIICQGLFLTNNVTFIAINGLVGMNLTPISWMATLPIMGYVVGGALSTSLVSKVQQRFGRQKSFQLGLLVAVVSALVCAFAAYQKNFWLLTCATLIAGFYSANGQLYRFAAAELTHASLKEKAVSWVLAGGLLGAVIGPNLASWTKNVFDVPFLGAYLSLAVAGSIGVYVMGKIEFPRESQLDRPQAAGADATPLGRSLSVIAKQPIFIVAAMTSALSYGIMNLLMAATPLAMEVCGYPFSDAALVLQWHVIGMFAPGFFTGDLIKRWGSLPIMWLGLFLNALCVAIALSGTELHQFFLAMLVLGIGWNFLFTGATTLALSTYLPAEKDKAQGLINFCVFSTMAITSLSSGALVTTQGWALLNWVSIFPLLLTAAGLFWLSRHQKKTA